MEYIRTAYAFYSQHRSSFDLFGMMLAVVGTLFAVLSIRDGRKMTRDLRAVFDHLTTKALGPFPDYMNDVERLIVNARDSVLIAVDFPGYGVWADRGRYGTLVKALENRKAERVRTGHKFDVQLLVLDAKGRERSLQDHFPDSSWREYVKRGSFARSRRMFEELENTRVSETRDRFIVEMQGRQDRALQAEFRFADRWEYPHVMPMHLFIADGEKAVFSIPGYGEELAEFGFITEEAGLVRALLSVWSRYVSESRKHGEDAPNVARMRA